MNHRDFDRLCWHQLNQLDQQEADSSSGRYHGLVFKSSWTSCYRSKHPPAKQTRRIPTYEDHQREETQLLSAVNTLRAAHFLWRVWGLGVNRSAPICKHFQFSHQFCADSSLRSNNSIWLKMDTSIIFSILTYKNVPTTLPRMQLNLQMLVAWSLEAATEMRSGKLNTSTHVTSHLFNQNLLIWALWV